jgi:4-hydroxy-L-threonine phosphate dehydrogenase PdxA
MKNKILLVSGEPNSINSEIIFKSLKAINNKFKEKIYLISNYELIKKQFATLRYKEKFVKVKSPYEITKKKGLKIIDIKLKFKNPFKVDKKESSKFVIKSLNYAHKHSLNKDVAGLINCPINKKSLNKNEFGVTEYLARKCKVNKNSELMLISNKKLSVCPITTHQNIKNVSKKITSDVIVKKINKINNWFIAKEKRKPKIAILGLNPHNSEFNKNSEEVKKIIPAVRKLKKLKININGPYSSDTIFINDYKKFDVIVGMYHDQVLSPYKALFKFDAINITLGLKYLRISPDHGTASNLIKKNKASPESLIKCLNFLKNYN